MSNSAVMGYGEVGKAVRSFYADPLIIEKDTQPEKQKVEVLNVCIPYSEEFEEQVGKAIEKYEPELVIIHSTVKVWTTKMLYEKYKNVVHSPIRGVHPHLAESIETFVKFIGADNKELGLKAQAHLTSLGINSEIMMPSGNSELGKEASTTAYGSAIEVHRYFNELCEKLGLDFDKVMTRFTETYNQGYKDMGMPNVVRPVLYPPKGKLGGHCIIPNAQMLEDQFGDNDILRPLTKQNKRTKISEEPLWY